MRRCQTRVVMGLPRLTPHGSSIYTPAVIHYTTIIGGCAARRADPVASGVISCHQVPFFTTFHPSPYPCCPSFARLWTLQTSATVNRPPNSRLGLWHRVCSGRAGSSVSQIKSLGSFGSEGGIVNRFRRGV